MPTTTIANCPCCQKHSGSGSGSGSSGSGSSRVTCCGQNLPARIYCTITGRTGTCTGPTVGKVVPLDYHAGINAYCGLFTDCGGTALMIQWQCAGGSLTNTNCFVGLPVSTGDCTAGFSNTWANATVNATNPPFAGAGSWHLFNPSHAACCPSSFENSDVSFSLSE